MPDAIALIVNPTAGRGRAATAAAEAAEHLRAAGLDVRAHATAGRGDGERLARDAGDVRAIVAVGGDGTFNEVLNGVGGRDVPLGLIPVGTANVLARELGLPLDVRRACAVIAAGHSRTVDVGFCNDRRFILMAGMGFDAAVVQELTRSRKGNIRLLSYASPILRALATYDAPPLRVEADGHLLATDARLVILSNARTYALGLQISPQARMDDGLLDVCVFRRHGLQALL
ncbi:MAG: YegS/Rv2252/BmrU family lipid kinase, partial [Planctomycetes bacterium]|nr:YegS/Rv2252/BmrU family lipid kinase [Planctomycetota bacterium]